MLTQTSRHALKALIYLTQHEDDWPITGPCIARHTGIPAKYLSKVLGDLVRADVLVSSKGKTGGFALAGPARKIPLLSIVAPFEQFHHRSCPFGNVDCSDESPCLGHNDWKNVIEAQKRFLERTSLLDVAVSRDQAPLQLSTPPRKRRRK